MRPDILNPLFAEVEVLKGIGPTLAKPLHRLKLDRVVDILFHLPISWICLLYTSPSPRDS